MKRYLLDTNTLSHLLKAHPHVVRQVTSRPIASLCMSAISKAELLYGVAKRPEATNLHRSVRELLLRVEALPWDGSIAELYGPLRAELERRGKTLAPLDLLIATHALDADATLVSGDRAFRHVHGLLVEDWTKSAS